MASQWRWPARVAVLWALLAHQPGWRSPHCLTMFRVPIGWMQSLISLIHDDEKPPLLTAREGGGGSPGPPGNVSRIGLPEYDWGMNAIHGVQSSCIKDDDGTVYCPTSFPNPVNYGFTWNYSAYLELGRIIGVETRALWLAGAVEASTWSGRPHIGLDTWSPNINIARSPLWGRNQEVPGEDPFMNGQFGKAYTLGLQGDDDTYLQAIVTLKHWDAYSLEDSDGATRHNFNAIVSNFSLMDTYWPAFRVAVTEGKAKGVMCSYNAVNGIPTCAHPLLRTVLRDLWKFDGYVSSDTGAVEDISDNHKYTPSWATAACAAIRDGQTDIDSGAVYMKSLLQGVSEGHCRMEDVDNALRNTLRLRFELGLFDPVENQSYWHVPLAAVNTNASRATNMLHTLESMVLLQNKNNVLPLASNTKVALIGPHAKAQEDMVGNYLGQLCPDNNFDCVVSPHDALVSILGTDAVTYAPGTNVTTCSQSHIDEAVSVATAADVAVLMLGIDESIEAESNDRKSIDLPECQHQLASAIFAVGKPTVIVLLNGGMLAIENEKQQADAIIEAGYPGFYGGTAIAQTLTGQNEHLGDYINWINMSDMEMTSGPGRTYRYYKNETLWAFHF
ncbi:uncharacterized protein MONBRDRAFT_36817 [Monosiga brevicollis MX1]|uniref:Fibronectin type III-like domain-containing protein n=1 Tax=Monosiga brevicollis TaxID=81824 RepID=A9UXZ0_MONBE|nr:uncharacterized protein MONBRDRAFT_36817 [Monosiga brevicollis MX1]EDQ89770.1 predicted protein [Monosiga brevicollis MX1]|eukprot:XP_001745192.1 hypothetical protein [Monosiga brevicollis MX1]